MMPEMLTVLIGALVMLAAIIVMLQLCSRRDLRALRNTMAVIKTNQNAIIAEAEQFHRGLIRDSCPMGAVVIDLHKRGTRHAASA